MNIFETEMTIARPIEEVFGFFSKAENLQRITPDAVDFKILTPLPIEMREGTLIDYKLKVRGVPMKWKTRIEEWAPPNRFVDVQLGGPYKTWHHTHEFMAVGPNETRMKDIVRYEVPLGILGSLVNRLFVRKDIEKIFKFRQQEIVRIFQA